MEVRSWESFKWSRSIQFVRSSRGFCIATLVEDAIESTVGEFGITDLERACPGVSRDMIRLLLRDLKAAGRLECLGRGPGAKWRKRVRKRVVNF